MEPPYPWALYTTHDRQELIYFNTETQEMFEEPPNLEELRSKVVNARRRKKTMQKRGEKQKQKARLKILGRNLPADVMEDDSRTISTPGRPSRSASKSKSRSRGKKGKGGGSGGSKRKGGAFGLLKGLRDRKKGREEDSEPRKGAGKRRGGGSKIGVIKEHKKTEDEIKEDMVTGKRLAKVQRKNRGRGGSGLGSMGGETSGGKLNTDEEFNDLMSSSEVNQMDLNQERGVRGVRNGKDSDIDSLGKNTKF